MAIDYSRLRGLTVRKIVHALEKEGFVRAKKRGADLVYRHPDGRRVPIHYHKGSETFPPKTLKKIIEAAGWTEEDLKRLKLLK